MYFVQRSERWWWQLFWQLRRQCMPVEVMAGVMVDIAVTLVGTLSEDMPRPAMLGLDTLVSVLAVGVVTNLRGPRGAMPALQGAHVIGMAAVTGEAVTGEAITGEAVTGIHPMDILGSAITVWAMATHTTTAMATHTTDTTLTVTDTGRP
jgi:hypothetical protein